MNFEIEKKKLLEFYEKGNTVCKYFLVELFGESTFKFDYTEIKSYEDACEVLGIEPVYFEKMNELLSNHDFPILEPDEIAYKKLSTISKALNDGWCPNWEDFNENKYYPWFNITKEEGCVISLVASGCISSLHTTFYVSSSSISSNCAGTFACKNQEIAIYFGNVFLKIWEEYLLSQKEK